jgi:hypothetical protein
LGPLSCLASGSLANLETFLQLGLCIRAGRASLLQGSQQLAIRSRCLCHTRSCLLHKMYLLEATKGQDGMELESCSCLTVQYCALGVQDRACVIGCEHNEGIRRRKTVMRTARCIPSSSSQELRSLHCPGAPPQECSRPPRIASTRMVLPV